MQFPRFFGELLYKVGNRLVRLSQRQPPANRFLAFAAPGHYYSPIPDADFVDKNSALLFPDNVASVPGVETDPAGQRKLVGELLKYAGDYHPATNADEARAAGALFFSDNPFFKELDAFLYYGMLRQRPPERVIEIGSGFSSALAVEVSRRFLEPSPQFVFLDPDPERLRGLLGPQDQPGISILEKPVQAMDRDFFLQLQAGDFLFIDSSHVSKIGSDVNFLFFEVLPRLRPGVIIHVHDIFWPFEYPKEWLAEGRSWNEAYLLHGLLSHSHRYRILCSSSYVAKCLPDLLEKFPSWVVAGQSSSIWLEVVS